jgi:hypothetical protein
MILNDGKEGMGDVDGEGSITRPKDQEDLEAGEGAATYDGRKEIS